MSGFKRRDVLHSAAALTVGVTVAGCSSDAFEVKEEKGAADAGPVIAVSTQRALAKVSRNIVGVNGAKWYDDAFGLWDAEADAPEPEAVKKMKQSGISLVRYPGGTSSNLFNWKGAIGPQPSRSRQLDGKDGDEVDSTYGPDEYMSLMKKIDGTPQIMAAFANSTPQEIADWVAYMNAPQGTKWGDLRAENGHPEPYGVRCWEIGNEIFGKHQRYWMSADDNTAIKQYAFGGTQRQRGQRVGQPTDHSPKASVSDGEPSQNFTVWYPPVVPKSQVVHVAGTEWRQVPDLSSAGASDEVYTFEPKSGAIRFGDGRHGAIPPQGAKITADYDSGPHAGFVDYSKAMKDVDPTIRVLSVWASIDQGKLMTGKMSFPRLMAEHGHADDYDGMAIHPYTNFSRDLHVTRFPDKRAGHDFQMLGETAAATMVTDLMDEMRKYGKKDPYVAASECGALFFGGERGAQTYTEYSYAMSHVLYMASQWAHFSNSGVAWTASNDLLSPKPGTARTVFGGAPDFMPMPEAIMREQLRDFFHGGGKIVDSKVNDNVEVATDETPLGSSYKALVTTASIDRDGALNVLVVNRSPDEDIKAHVAPDDFTPAGTVDVSVVAGRTFYDFNSKERPNSVKIEKSQAKTDAKTLDWSFKAHSVTLLRFPAQS
ncbi:hypothetical protein ABZ370_41260 [Streptomyces sp. NPDC005962]|uniref:hypothetical protein n=1 Tax=Streptomyces sp. NPDC005962 TaxID=3154466 RepID=UPI003404098D